MLEQFSALPAFWLSLIAGLLGLLVGSFLNVVIFRYPKKLKYEWTVQSREWLEIPSPPDEVSPPGLVLPPSHCGHCGAEVKPWQNIPIISFLILKAKCGSCGAPISWRYPIVELLTGVLSAMLVYQFGWGLQSLFGLLFTWVLVALTFIDFDHKLLPDDIVLPTLWLGLVINLWNVFSDTRSALIGAIVGYLIFWTVFQIFLRLTGKEGMGYGDFKLMSLLGAWLGWQFLPQIVLISTLVGSVFGIAIMVKQRADGDLAIPFGPYITFAGWLAMCWGDEINTAYFKFMGL